MNPSPLQLERHFFSKVQVDAHTDGVVGTPNELQSQVEVGRSEQTPERFQVTLRLKILSPSSKKATYTGEIHAIGLFTVADSWPKDDLLKLVQANGAAVLYAAARELFCNLTARGPWPMLSLNTVTFIPQKAGGKKAAHETARRA